MELADAIKCGIPLQVCLPDRRRPLLVQPHPAAEVFIVETVRGSAVVWLDLFWCDPRRDRPESEAHAGHEAAAAAACHIAYALPRSHPTAERWIDNDPAFGPYCIPWQKPFVIERLHTESPGWHRYTDWQTQRRSDRHACGRLDAWRRVEELFGELISSRIV